MADIQAMLRQTKPQVVFSASVGAVPKSALKHFQDGRRWADERLLDALLLMNYVETAADFAKRVEPWLADPPPIPIVPGLWFGRHKDQTTLVKQSEEQRQTRQVRREVLLPYLRELAEQAD